MLKTPNLMITNNFSRRHIGPCAQDVKMMLDKIGVDSLDTLIGQTVPQSIHLKKDLDLPAGMNEYEFLNYLKTIGSRNKIFKCFIGLDSSKFELIVNCFILESLS